MSLEEYDFRLIYTVSFDELIEIWIDALHPLDHVVIIWDAVNHYDYLKSKGINLNQAKLYNNKILTIIVDSCEIGLEVLDMFSKDTDPFLQLYSHGKLITDNIDK